MEGAHHAVHRGMHAAGAPGDARDTPPVPGWTPASARIGVLRISRGPIADRGCQLQGGKGLLDGHQDRRLNGAQVAAPADGDRDGGHIDIGRGFPQVVPVVLAEGMPESMQRTANRFDVPGSGGAAISGCSTSLAQVASSS